MYQSKICSYERHTPIGGTGRICPLPRLPKKCVFVLLSYLALTDPTMDIRIRGVGVAGVYFLAVRDTIVPIRSTKTLKIKGQLFSTKSNNGDLGGTGSLRIQRHTFF